LSGIKDWNLTLFYRRLRRRGWDASRLAAAIKSGRTHVTAVLNGTTDSPRTRARLAPLLKQRELELVGWDVNGAIVPRDAMSAGRHFSEANAV